MILNRVIYNNVLNKLHAQFIFKANRTSFNLSQSIHIYNQFEPHSKHRNANRTTSNNSLLLQSSFGDNSQCIKHSSNLSFSKYTLDAAPTKWKPYMKLIRWDRPIGSWLLFLPCTWSIFLAADHMQQLPDMKTLALFAAGSVVMRSAGCTINDMWDRDFDRRVERTKDRPLVSGEITYPQALGFLAGQLSIALGILLSFDWTSILIGASSLGLVIIYPLMKRVTYWPQLFLGLTLNFGILISWQDIVGTLSPACLTLYGSAALWTIIYDSVYSHQDKEDDQLIGVKSTALRFGDNSKIWLTAFAATMCSGLVGTGVMCDQAWPYYLGVGMVSSHLAYQLYSTNLNNPTHCSQTFRSNRNLGILLWFAIMASSAVKYNQRLKEEDCDKTENVDG